MGHSILADYKQRASPNTDNIDFQSRISDGPRGRVSVVWLLSQDKRNCEGFLGLATMRVPASVEDRIHLEQHLTVATNNT